MSFPSNHMPKKTYSSSVLLIDDEKPFLGYLRKNFHNHTTIGVLTASDLKSARAILDRPDVPIDAVVSDLFFDVGRDEPEAGLNDGVDLLAYVHTCRPRIPRYIMSYYAESSAYEDKLHEKGVTVNGEFLKMMYADCEGQQSPWLVIERDLLKQRLEADSTLSQWTDDSISEFARKVQWPVRTFLQDLISYDQSPSHPPVILRSEIRVLCTQEVDDMGVTTVTATAFDLGLLTPGFGQSVEEALDSLKSVILEQYHELRSEDSEKLKGYARLVKQRLDEIVSVDSSAE